MEICKFKVATRNTNGKNSNNRLRASGAVLYGKNQPTISLQLDPKEFAKALDPEKKRNTFLELEVEGGEKTTALVREVQYNSVTSKVVHIDFVRTNAEDKVSVIVPFKLIGKAEGMKLGGRIRQIMRHLPISCAAGNIPSSIIYDVTPMLLEVTLRVQDLVVEDHLKVSLDGRQALVICTGKKEEEYVDEAAKVAVEGEEAVAETKE
jgi:large subunit ribosomal protein L25